MNSPMVLRIKTFIINWSHITTILNQYVLIHEVRPTSILRIYNFHIGLHIDHFRDVALLHILEIPLL
jgi:hypothetical protein